MFDLNRYDFISIQFCGCPQTLWRSDAGNFPIRSHLVRLRGIMSRNACHDVHRGSFFRFGTVSISSCTDCILDAEYEAISFSLRTRSEETNYRLITNRFLGWKGYQYPIDFKFGWAAWNGKTNKLNGLDRHNYVVVMWLSYKIRTE